MEPINPLYVCIAFAIAALLKLYRSQVEQAFSRAVVAMWYGYVYFAPIIDIETQRLFGRFVIYQLGVVEILSFVLRAWFTKKYTDAMRTKHND